MDPKIFTNEAKRVRRGTSGPTRCSFSVVGQAVLLGLLSFGCVKIDESGLEGAHSSPTAGRGGSVDPDRAVDAATSDAIDGRRADAPPVLTDAAPTADADPEVATCLAPLVPCALPGSTNIACVSVTDDEKHCGVCGQACAADLSCVAGVCTCNTGETLCDGACVELASDADNCGACGKGCPRNQVCSNGKCAPGCDDMLLRCNGNCVDPKASSRNCGTCGNSCGQGADCSDGVCTCMAGRSTCNGACVNLSTSTTHCGMCGNTCGRNQVCRAGACTLVCPENQTNCGETCVNTKRDADNCGACGNKCRGGRLCLAGACRL